MKKKQLSPKSQKMLDVMMKQVRKDMPMLHSITEKIKGLSTPEGRLEIAKAISKVKKDESITAPIFKNRESMK